MEEVTYSVWTEETFERLDYNGRPIETQANPYGVIPFIPIWDRIPTGDF